MFFLRSSRMMLSSRGHGLLSYGNLKLMAVFLFKNWTFYIQWLVPIIYIQFFLNNKYILKIVKIKFYIKS